MLIVSQCMVTPEKEDLYNSVENRPHKWIIRANIYQILQSNNHKNKENNESFFKRSEEILLMKYPCISISHNIWVNEQIYLLICY